MLPSRFLGLRKCVGHLCKSVNNINVRSYSLATKTATKEIDKEFVAVFPSVIKDLTNTQNSEDIAEVKQWYSKVLEYNVPEGKKIRGLTVVRSYRLISKDESEDNLRLSCILGWCVELLQAYFLLIDDILDDSDMRRGQPAWHKVQGVGVNTAIVDGLLLRSGLYELLRIHFKDKPYYLPLNDVFDEASQYTEFGQSMDIRTSMANDYGLFTMQRYNTIVKYKTAYYSFYLPVAAAMHMAGISQKAVHDEAKQILFQIAKIFQVQDDFIDVYGDPKVSGKLGTDIKDRKCSWLAVVALERANPKQRAAFIDCYGSSDPNKIAKVMEVFNEVGIQSQYHSFEEKSFNMLTTAINRMNSSIPKEVFTNLLNSFYKRCR